MKRIFKWIRKKINETDEDIGNNTKEDTMEFKITDERYFYHHINSRGEIIEYVSNNFSNRAYCISDNTFWEMEPRCFYLFKSCEISKDKYESLYKNHICNCEIGAGSNIRESANPYSLEEVEKILKENFPEYNIKYDSKYSSCALYYYFTSKGNDLKRFRLKNLPRKKACLDCGTCLDEIKDVIKDFQKFICKMEEEKKINKQIEEICAN